MSDISLEYERKELNKAQNLGIFGLIGALIPLIGLMLGIISLVTAYSVKPSHAYTKSKKTSVLIIAWIAIVLSILAGIGYYSIYQNAQKNERNSAAQALREKEQDEQAAQSRDKAAQATLNFCLNQADNNYNQYLELNSTRTTTDSDGQKVYYMPQHNWDYADQKKKTEKDECYRAAAAGDTTN